MDRLYNAVTDAFAQAQGWLFESLLQPLMVALGLSEFLEQGYRGTGWLMVGVLQIAVMLALIGPLERLRPAEPMRDRAAVRTDVLYTLIHRLGLFRVAMFFSLDPVADAVFGWLRVQGIHTVHLDQVWPGVTDIGWVSLLIYLVVFDFVDYWIHRGQHRIGWWWSLHALHHSQQQMTMWTDNRNHLLDDIVRSLIIATVAQAIGVPPEQYVAIVAITQLSESLQHANVTLPFGRLGERLWVSPRFHRVHHAIGLGHEGPGVAAPAPGTRSAALGGHNFAVLLPVWDALFGTADWRAQPEATGIRDQVEPGPDGRVRDYGRGFVAQQWLGLLRLLGRA